LACKKKLYALNPKLPKPQVQTQRTFRQQRLEYCDRQSLERGVRQLLADKVSGNHVGLWLLIPEHLRLGSWDLLCGWTGQPTQSLEPRLALQLVHEAALCVKSLRLNRCLSQRGFELANGLPFVASDQAIHDLLEAHTLAQAQNLQVALGKLRLASGHFQGKVLAIDPHRLRSLSKRQMRRRRSQTNQRAEKVAQTFFCLDTDTSQPICFTLASSARTVSQATPELLQLTRAIFNLPAQPTQGAAPLLLADTEHYTAQLIDQIALDSPFDLLVPMRHNRSLQRHCQALPQSTFTSHWVGYATTKELYRPQDSRSHKPYYHLIQRSGQAPGQYHFKSFLDTANHQAAEQLSIHFPQRWHVEEFFRFDQALGWQRAGTLNLHIRYGQMSLALVAQALIHQFRQRIGQPFCNWDAPHLAQQIFTGLEGDIRVQGQTILVTYYNAPHPEILQEHYQGLPDKLRAQGVDPHIPWLYGYELDFRFK
jgi:hypothetical protein